MQPLLRLLHGLMAALFLFAAALQYNDADPLRWIAIYLAAGAACVFAVLLRPRPMWAAATGAIALAWAMLYVIHHAWEVPFPALFYRWEMTDGTIVAGREMYGLFIVAGWMAVTWATGRRRSVTTTSSD